MKGLLLAVNRKEFDNWCLVAGIDTKDYKYLDKINSIYGHKDCNIFLLPSAFWNDDYEKIKEYCINHNIKKKLWNELKEVKKMPNLKDEDATEEDLEAQRTDAAERENHRKEVEGEEIV